jgi:hypothetical protein
MIVSGYVGHQWPGMAALCVQKPFSRSPSFTTEHQWFRIKAYLVRCFTTDSTDTTDTERKVDFL